MALAWLKEMTLALMMTETLALAWLAFLSCRDKDEVEWRWWWYMYTTTTLYFCLKIKQNTVEMLRRAGWQPQKNEDKHRADTNAQLFANPPEFGFIPWSKNICFQPFRLTVMPKIVCLCIVL